MADRTLEGISLGAQLVQQGFDEYQKKKEWQERLAERADLKGQRQAEVEYKKGELARQTARDASEDAFRKSEIEEKKSRDAAEIAHWHAMEGRGRGGAGSHEMTPAQATSAIGEIDRIFSKSGAPAMDESTWNRRETLKSTQIPGYKPRKFEPATDAGFHPLNWLYGKVTGADKKASASGLPGLE